MEHQVTLLVHFIGFGLLVTVSVAGIILNRQYRKAADFQTKALILRSLRPIGILSPIGIIIMLVSGIGNMHDLGLGLLDAGWLTAKIIFFAIATISGILFGIVAGKRGKLVQEIATGKAQAEAPRQLEALDRQVMMFYIVLPVLLLIIVWLSIYGKLGGQ